MPKLFIVALAVLGALLLPAAAASAKDRNHDRLPDRWEKKHHLSLHVKQTRRDQDGDGLRNLGEFKAGMDPRDEDSDDDGLSDDDENAGTITAFADGKLTIQTFGGDEVTGAVTDATEIECEGSDDQGDDEGDDHGDDDATATLADHGDDDNSGPGSDDEGDDDQGEDDQGDDENEDACAPGALSVGAKVHEAELKVGADGAVWDEIELR